MVLKAYRYRFYPCASLILFLAKTFGACRFVYNYFLDEKQKRHKEKGETLSYNTCAKMLAEMKDVHIWLKEVSSVPLQQSLRHLEAGFQKFYKKQARFPQYKKKHGDQSATFMKNAFKYENGNLTLAKFGVPLNIRWSRIFKGDPVSITISKDSRGRYFVSFLVEEFIKPLPTICQTIGVDVGLKTMIATSDGKKESSMHFLKKQLGRLRRRQKALSRKTKGSANRTKAKKILASLAGKIRDRRFDYIHKKTTALVRENQVICAETLSVKKMMKNKRLARSIGDASWGTFLQLLEYKCAWYGRRFVKIGRFFPSSKKCSECKSVNQSLTLQDRIWTCPVCNRLLDRDINAANNIEEEGLRLIGWNTVGHTGFKACGADVRPMWQPTWRSAVNQELGLQKLRILCL
jgi:putative transposase